MDAFQVGMAGVYLGVGRNTAADSVYPDVGFEIFLKPGDAVEKGQPLARMWGHDTDSLDKAKETFLSGVEIHATAPDTPDSMILEELSTL